MVKKKQSLPQEKISFDISHRPIKAVSIAQIEEAFSKALGELTGMAYKVSINKLDLNHHPNAALFDSSFIELTLSAPQDETIPF